MNDVITGACKAIALPIRWAPIHVLVARLACPKTAQQKDQSSVSVLILEAVRFQVIAGIGSRAPR